LFIKFENRNPRETPIAEHKIPTGALGSVLRTFRLLFFSAMEPTSSALRGKVCLITGATSGIGLVTARELARRGARLVIVGRNQTRCDNALAQIRADTGNAQTEALLADLSVQQQVRALARQFLDRYPRLDVLVNNAGGLWLRRELTLDGLEMTF